MRVEVANVGPRFGEEVVQLYAQIRRRGVTRPVRELVGFQRIALHPGAAAVVTFHLRPEILAYYDVEMNLVLTPGDVHLSAGRASDDLALSASFTIVGEQVTLSSRTAHLTVSTVQ